VKRIAAALAFALGLALLAGCTGYTHLGLSREEERAYTRSDSSCDDGWRASDLGSRCYVPRPGGEE
jgi:hypothetical protein